jgi:hypothetical protein
MDKEINMDAVPEEEYEAAVKEAENSRDVYKQVFQKPFVFEEESFDSLTFDFGSLTAADSLAIEREVAALGQTVITPEFSGEYLIRMAVRACTDRRKDGRKLGVDAFMTMPIGAFTRIRSRARSFLLNAGS